MQNDSVMCKYYSHQISALYLIPFLRKWEGDLRSPKKPSPNRVNCVKSVQIRRFFWSEYRKIRTNCLNTEVFLVWIQENTDPVSKYGVFSDTYLVRIQENTDQKKSVFGHFSCSQLTIFKMVIHLYRLAKDIQK